jgi:hypothetical protein
MVANSMYVAGQRYQVDREESCRGTHKNRSLPEGRWLAMVMSRHFDLNEREIRLVRT